MRRGLLQFSVGGFFAIGLSLLSQPAQANPVLPNLVNLNFVNYSGSAPKNTFTNVNPVGWTGGSGLIFIATPGTSANSNSACGTTYLQTYVCPSTLPIGAYNEVEADGNPEFESGFNYTITGLTKGTTYDLSFYQAAGQQTTFQGATTEQWIVSLGTSGITDNWVSSGMTCNPCTYSNPDINASIVPTTIMNTPSKGGTDWNFVTVSLTADASTDILSFLAWGNNGSTTNLPPIVFLTGVNAAPPSVPEPGSIFLFGTVLLGVGGVIRHRRRVSTPTV